MNSQLAIPEALAELLPALTTKVEQYFGSFVRVECLSASGKQIEARVQLADWCLTAKGDTVADSAGSSEVNNPKLRALVGERLLRAEVAKRGEELWLLFTGEHALCLKANHDDYQPDDELLVIALDAQFIEYSTECGFVVAPRSRTAH